jgi:hypothetical protein
MMLDRELGIDVLTKCPTILSLNGTLHSPNRRPCCKYPQSVEARMPSPHLHYLSYVYVEKGCA